jgi:MoaA/NifB/PqqE/SkfB family radical SAM enzyme
VKMRAALEIVPKLLGFRFAHATDSTPPLPINLTYSVTNLCQSKCLSCNIWRFYRDEPQKFKDELKIDEVEKVFRSFGHVYFFNISGGEPFLRKDLEEIVRLACRHLTPRVIHCPTNVLCPKRVLDGTRKILEIIREELPGTPFTIKPSYDGIGPEHDRIRGVKGNFDRLLEAVAGLKELKKEFPNLHLGLGTVISQYNIKDLPQIADYALKLGVDTYISEVAEERTEMKNAADGMTPSADDYERAIQPFKRKIEETLPKLSGLARVTQTLRTLYYDLTVRILREKRQVIPCYGGISNAHMNPYGDIWPCAILGYEKPMGNVREHGHDFRALWGSPQAQDVRRYIKAGKCACPLANQSYANLLLHPPSAFKAAAAMVAPSLVTGSKPVSA